MKSRVSWKWSLGLALVVLPLASHCLHKAAGSLEESAVAGQLDTNLNVAPQTSAAPAVATAEPTPGAAVSDAPATVVSTEKPLPPGIRPSSPAAEVIKLANSGVEEGVMLSFVTNSAGTFDLGADDIIYLQDLGVPPSVVTAMIERDQALKALAASTAAPPGPTASAPYPAESSAAPTPYPAESAAPTPTEPALPPDYGTEAAAAAPAPADTSYTDFYDSLAPYGTWVDVGGYGLCWQPTVVILNAGWRPYWNCGRWLYSDCGWYWHSDYSWGWAPFHYGRWFCHARLGWCWAPDTVWGPSWVCWRYSNDYCGWAPLPPAACYRAGAGFTYFGRPVSVSFGFGLGANSFGFVPMNRFCDRHVAQYAVPPNHVTRIYSSTVASTAMLGSRNHIFNVGVPRDRVAAASHTRINRVALRDMTGSSSGGPHVERFGANGQTLSVFRPAIPATAGTRPTTTSFPNSRPGVRTLSGPPTTSHTAPGQTAPASARPAAGRPQSPGYSTPQRPRTGAGVNAPSSTAVFARTDANAAPEPVRPQTATRGTGPRTDQNGNQGGRLSPGAPLIVHGPDRSPQVAQELGTTTTGSPRPSAQLRYNGSMPAAHSSSQAVPRPSPQSVPTPGWQAQRSSPSPAQRQNISSSRPQGPPTMANSSSQTVPRQNPQSAPTPGWQAQRSSPSPAQRPNDSSSRPQGSPTTANALAQLQQPSAGLWSAQSPNVSAARPQPGDSVRPPQAPSFSRQDTYSRTPAPLPQSHSTPSYQAPARPTAPAVSYSAPRSSAPAAVAPAPAPATPPTSAPSAPASSGRGGRR